MINRLPAWFRQDIPDTSTLEKIHLLSKFNVHTVCQEARCPNLSYCFKNSRLTFMLLGDTCTRNCRFCAVSPVRSKLSEATAPPLAGTSNGVSLSADNLKDFDLDEPFRIREAVKRLGLNYVVITSVTRDDLQDGGAGIFAKTVELIRKDNPQAEVEVLIPDFGGKTESLKCVLDAHPDIIAHNLETVERLYKDLKPACDYRVSLGILKKIKELKPSMLTKSSLILGVGEKETEVIQTMRDLRNVSCDILTLGQYLAASKQNYPVKEFVSFEQFQRYREIGLNLGFKAVLSGPLVRSSYYAQELYKTCMTSS